MRSFDIGLSALRAHQQTLATLGHNIANASTPGYHRQRVELINRPPLESDKLHIGTGVDVSRISRLRDSAIETALLRNGSLHGYTQQSLDTVRQIESFLTPGDTSIHADLSDFFNRLEQVTNAPQDMTVRSEFLSSAQDLAQGFNNLSDLLTDLHEDVQRSLDDGIAQVNLLVKNIADVNQKIYEAQAMQRIPNDLLDRRDQLITALSGYLDVELEVNHSGREFLVVGSGVGVVGQRPLEFELATGSDGTLGIRQVGLTNVVPLAGGRLRALLEAANETIPETRQRLAALAGQILQAVDQQHAQGLPDSGPFEFLNGSRVVSDVTIPLASASPAFPITAGDLYVTITEQATGIRRTHRISIDPGVDSLEAVAARLDAVSGLAATVDAGRGTLSLHAEAGSAFDFAGRADNRPDLTAFTGTSLPQFSGQYTGSLNTTWQLTFSGPGTIGVTPGLEATVLDQNGQVLARFNAGAGYEAGQPVAIQDGLSLQLGTGTVAAGDQASLFVVATADETGALAALGLNTLFAGSLIGDLRVRPDLLQTPQSLTGSITGMPGESSNFARLAGLRDLRFTSIGGRTFTEELADITADAGLSVQAAENQNIQAENLQQRLEADRDAVSGVDINEEMLRMLEVERGYQAASRFISTINSTLDELFRLVQ